MVEPIFHPFVVSLVTIKEGFLSLKGYYDLPYTHLRGEILAQVSLVTDTENWKTWIFLKNPRLALTDEVDSHEVILLTQTQRIDSITLETEAETGDVTIHLQEYGYTIQDYGMVIEGEDVSLTGDKDSYKVNTAFYAVDVLVFNAPYHS